MSIQNINEVINEPISDEALSLKEKIRERKDAIGITNQDIADLSGLSIHTVNNYFSNKSKASSAYTVGKICMVLKVSMDRAFSIQPEDLPEENAKHEENIAQLEQHCRDLERDLVHKDELLKEKDAALKSALEEVKKRGPIIKMLILAIIIICGFAFLYLLTFDLTNPQYGLFTKALSAASAVKSNYSTFVL